MAVNTKLFPNSQANQNSILLSYSEIFSTFKFIHCHNILVIATVLIFSSLETETEREDFKLFILADDD